MAEGLNLLILFGRIGSDPEMRTTGGGKEVLKFSLATTERYKQGDEWKERTDWHKCVLWGARASSLAKILHKGSLVMVMGSSQTRSWDGEDGKKQYMTECNVNKVFLGSKDAGDEGHGGGDERQQGGGYQRSGGGGGGQRSQGRQQAPANQAQADDAAAGDFDNDDGGDLPF